MARTERRQRAGAGSGARRATHAVHAHGSGPADALRAALCVCVCVCVWLQRFGYVMDVWTRLCGGVRPAFSNANYLHRKESADRHYAFAYMMVRAQHDLRLSTALVARRATT